MFRRILAAAALLVLAALLLVVLWPQLLGLQRAPVIAQIVALRGLCLAIAAVLAIGALLLVLISRGARRFAASVLVLLLAFCAVTAALLGIRGIHPTAPTAPDAATPADTEQITVLAWNTLGDAPGAERIAQLALEVGADVISLPETSNTTGTRVAELMGDAGHPMWAHAFRYGTYAKARTTAMLISTDLGQYQLDQSLGSTPVLPSGLFRPIDGTGPTIVAAHPVSPTPGQMENWRVGLNWLAARCADNPDVIMAGDFNSTIDHWDGLGAEGGVLGTCRDAAREVGGAGIGTWPTDLPPLLGAPIDHVLIGSAWKATGFRVIETDDLSGSDHRPVVAQLTRVGD